MKEKFEVAYDYIYYYYYFHFIIFIHYVSNNLIFNKNANIIHLTNFNLKYIINNH